RIFETRDMDGRITRIVLGFVIQEPTNPKATVAMLEDDQRQFVAELTAINVREGVRNTDPVFFVRGGQQHQFNSFLSERMNAAITHSTPNAIRITIPYDGWLLRVDQNSPIHFESIVVDFQVDEERLTTQIVSQRVAELVLSGFGFSDLIIFGD